MVRVRFAPSPTGSLHLGGALTAVANRIFADERGGGFVLRIDDTDAARSNSAAEDGILADLAWLGIGWDEGPIRQSGRGERYREAAAGLLATGAAFEEEGAVRYGSERRRATILRADGTATYHLASVVDDLDLRITHVIRGRDHLPNQSLHEALVRSLGGEPPIYVHHGLVVGADGRKLSKRDGATSVADLRDAGVPGEAVRAYLEELDLPRHDVQLDRARIGRLAIDAIASLPDDELAGRVGAPLAFVPALRGARTLAEARTTAGLLAARPAPHGPTDERALLTLRRFHDLRELGPERLGEPEARALVRELKAVGGDLRALRLALTGAASGPELWTLLSALDREEALARTAAT